MMSDLGLHCLFMSYKTDTRLTWVKAYSYDDIPGGCSDKVPTEKKKDKKTKQSNPIVKFLGLIFRDSFLPRHFFEHLFPMKSIQEHLRQLLQMVVWYPASPTLSFESGTSVQWDYTLCCLKMAACVTTPRFTTYYC